MNEAQRQFVMGVAGVRLWYAREPLPGAAPSPEFDFGEEGAPASAVDEPAVVAVPRAPEPSPEAARRGLARLQGLKAATAGEPAKSQTQSGKPPRPSAVSEALRPGEDPVQETRGPAEVAPSDLEEPSASLVRDELAGRSVAFHWRFWVGERWLLASACSDAAARGLEDRLASNILRALGDRVTNTESLRWPVFSNPAVPGNDAAGALEVVSSLASAIKRPHQLWLGLEPEEGDAVALWQQLCGPLGQASVSVPATLASLSSDPAGKRAVWRALNSIGSS